jgi:hypothetical protein
MGEQTDMVSAWDTEAAAMDECRRLDGPYYVARLSVRSAESLDKMAPVHRVETGQCHQCRWWSQSAIGLHWDFGQCRRGRWCGLPVWRMGEATEMGCGEFTAK